VADAAATIQDKDHNMPTRKSRRFMFLLFGALYFVQGVIVSYQQNFFKPHMDAEGIDADRIALVATLALVPFIVKVVFGMLSDRVNMLGLGHRVPYMVLGVLACSLMFLAAFFVDPSETFWLVATLVLTATFAMALFDTTADAYAIEAMPSEDYGRVQSVMTGGRAAGLIILSFVFGLLAKRYGFSVIFVVIAAILLLPLILLFQIKEPAQRPQGKRFDWRAFKVMLRPGYLLFGLFLMLSWFAFEGIEGLITFYMSKSLGADEIVLGNYGTIKGIGMVLGALLLTLIVSRWRLKVAALVTLALVSVGGLAFSRCTSCALALGMGLGWGIVVGLQWSVYGAVAMGITDQRIAGSMFALFQMMANIGMAAGQGIATSLSARIGFTGVFVLLAALNLLLIPFFMLVNRRLEAKRVEAKAVAAA
jgi:PAT family beta-lactamase induction signal transducer AmpG